MIDPKRSRPLVHPRVREFDGYVLCELVPVSLAKPAWPERDQLDKPPAPVNDRLPQIVDLDQAVTV